MLFQFRRALAVCFAIFCGPGIAWGLTVDVHAPATLKDELSAASLSAGLLNQDAVPRPIDVISAAQADYARLIALLYDKGYFGPEISILIDGQEAAGLSPVASPPTTKSVNIMVDPGQVFSFGRVLVQPKAPGTETVLQAKSGEIASVTTLRAATAAGIEGWRNQGHAKASVASQKITADHPNTQINADIRLDPGPRLRFGALHISSNSAVRQKRIRDIAGWPKGDVFHPEELEKVERRLRRTGTFSAASLTEATSANPDDTLDVTLQLTDQLPRRYSFGAEISTTEGVSLNALWLHRNFFGGAERFQIDGEISSPVTSEDGADYRLTAQLSRPATWRTDLEALLLADIAQRDDPNLFSRTGRLEFGTLYHATEDREYRLGVGLQTAEIRDDLGERDYTILSFPLAVQFDRRDDAMDASDGYYFEAGLRPFFNINGTDDGVVTTLDLRSYRKVGNKVVVAVRGQLGSVAGPSIAQAPADFLFFSGGSGTVRGQDFQSLGANLNPSVTIGGRSYIGMQGEVRIKTGERVSIVGFYDAGYIGAESFFNGSGEWHTGYGFGVRYSTGIGPIRVDIGLPGSGPTQTSGAELYIGIGQAF